MARLMHDVAAILAARTGHGVLDVRARLIAHARTSGLVPDATEHTVVDDDTVRALLAAGTETDPTTSRDGTATVGTTAATAITTAHQTHQARPRRRRS